MLLFQGLGLLTVGNRSRRRKREKRVVEEPLKKSGEKFVGFSLLSTDSLGLLKNIESQREDSKNSKREREPRYCALCCNG